MNTEVEVQNHSAAYYEVRYTGFGKRYHQHVIQQLLQGMNGHLLDAGCGTGFVSECAPDLDITGIDLSPGMLKQYRGKECHLMDVCKLPKEWGHRYDGVICRSLLHHLPNHMAGLREMHRVMKSGAKISFWETNQSTLASFIRSRTQHGDRFSAFHRSFKDTELLFDIGKWFEVEEVKYLGFLQYPLYGFPDILKLYKLIPFNSVIYPLTGWVDRQLSESSWFKRMSWSILIRAHKV